VSEPVGVDIKVLDKDYRISCPPEERDDLLVSARLLDARMREIRQTGRVIGSDRIAVLAALNIANELIQLQRAQGGGETAVTRRLGRLQERIGEALTGHASGHSGLDSGGERV
jgi:cell division protein ZapA